MLRIYYEHHDCPVDKNISWEDEYECAVDAECPACGMRDIVPVSWEEIEDVQ